MQEEKKPAQVSPSGLFQLVLCSVEDLLLKSHKLSSVRIHG